MSFRFLDFPDEIKDLVYGFCATDFLLHNGKQLARVRSPALAQVSKELRKNFLAVFFKDSAFDIIVGPRYPRGDLGPEYRGPIDGILEWKSDDLDRTMSAAMDPDDPIFLQRSASLLVSHAETFHKITFVMHQFRTRSRRQQWAWREYVFGVPLNKNGRRYVAVSFAWSKGKLEIQKWPADPLKAPPDAFRLFERTIRVARKMTTRKDFKGFSVQDLREVTMAFVAAIER